MFESLLIAFREGLEAFLIVAVATLYLRKTGKHALVGAVRSGLVFSLLACAVLGALLARLGTVSPAWEGSLAIVAAAAVAWCVWHMKHMGRYMGSEISGGLQQATLLQGPRAWWAVFGFTCFMVGREGIETAAMLASLAGNAQGSTMLMGGVIGLATAATVALAWVKLGRQVNLGRFFDVTGVFMLVFAGLLALKAFHEFTEGGLIPGIDNAYWHMTTESLAEGPIAELISVALVLAPTLWLAVTHWLDCRKPAAAGTATSSAG